MTRKQHWDTVYQANAPADLTWHQTRPAMSLRLIFTTEIQPGAGVIDIGGGLSPLVDCLLEAGYSGLAVLDVSGAALKETRVRLGERAARAVEWFEQDVTTFAPPHRFAVWHDRAVFHFLTKSVDRHNYVAALLKTVHPGGHVIIATFALDGPPRCSGLEVVRYKEETLAAELGPEFVLRETVRETHLTPWQSEQRFVYFRFERLIG